MWESYLLLRNIELVVAYIRWPVPGGPYLRVAGNSPPACFAGRVEIRHVIFIKRPCGHFLLFDFRVSFV